MAKAKKPLTKRQRSMLIAAAALLVVVLVVVIIAVIPGGKGEEESSSSQVSTVELITLVEAAPGDLDRVEVSNVNGGYTALLATETVDGTETYKMRIEELGKVDAIDTANFSALSSRLSSIKATDLITDDMSRKGEFGFDSPQSTVKYVFNDGREVTIYIGDAAPSTAGYYVMSEDKIYLAQLNMCTLFLQDYRYFVDRALTLSVDLEQYSVQFAGFKLGGTMRPDEIVINYDPSVMTESEYILVGSSYRMKAGELEKGVRASIIDNYFPTVLNLTASDVMVVEPTEAELKEYGLAEPYSEVEFSLFLDETMKDFYSYTLKISEPKDGACYVMHDDVDIIYKMDFSDKTMLDVTFNDMVDTMPLLPYITKIESIVYKTPENEYVFEIEHYTDEDDKDQIIVTCNGETLNSDYFRTFYGTTIGITGDEYLNVEDVPDIATLGEPILEITYKYIGSEKADDVVAVYKGPTRRSYVAHNGQIEFLTKTTKVELSMKNCVKVLNGEETSY